MLASGAHIKIDTHEFLIEERFDLPFVHYRHIKEPFYAQGNEGAPGTENLRAEIKQWVRDDWSGGEGDKFYDAEHPDLYFTSVDTSPRLVGAIRSRPTVSTSTLT